MENRFKTIAGGLLVFVVFLIMPIVVVAEKMEPITSIRELDRTIETKNVNTKNYTLNEIKTVYIGEAVVDKSNWTMDEMFANQQIDIVDISAMLLEDIDLAGYPTIKAGEYLPISKNTDGTYAIPYFNLLGSAVGSMIVTKDGEISRIDGPGFFAWQRMEVPAELAGKKAFNIIDNSSTKVLRKKESEIIKGTSFQLVYTGLENSGKDIKLTYKEFVDDKIRPAFTEKYTYSKTDKYIRFKQIKIEVIKATSEQITYKVLTD